MKHKCLAAIIVMSLVGLPLAAQKVVRIQHSSMPTTVVADYESSGGHSYLGVGVSDLSSDRVQALKLKDDRGVEVTQVDQEAPAGKAGLKEHDVIVGFNGTPVESQEQFKRLMRETPPGRTVSINVIRDGQQQSVKVQLADRKTFESSMAPHAPGDFALVMPSMPPMPAMPDFPRTFSDQTLIRVRSNAGATLENLTPQLGDYFGVKNGEGMLVRSVQKGSAAEAAGLRAGDIIVRVGDQKITDNSDWRQAMRGSKDGKIPVVIVRDRKEQTLSLAVPVRKGPDSSAVYREDCPDLDAEDVIEEAAPLVQESLETGIDVANDVLSSPEVNEAMQKAMQEMHRQLIENRSELNREINNSMKVASAQLKAHRVEIEKAMRDARRSLDKVRVEFGTDMQ